jgi:hypothetical protein
MSRRDGLQPVKGRDGRGRTVPMSEDLAARLREHLSRTVASIDGWLFTSPMGGRVRYNNWRARTWSRVVEAADVGEVKAHDLRHTLATRLFVVDGWSVPQVQAMLDHVDQTVTLRVYTHVRSEELPEPSSGHYVDTVSVTLIGWNTAFSPTTSTTTTAGQSSADNGSTVKCTDCGSSTGAMAALCGAGNSTKGLRWGSGRPTTVRVPW